MSTTAIIISIALIIVISGFICFHVGCLYAINRFEQDRQTTITTESLPRLLDQLGLVAVPKGVDFMARGAKQPWEGV